MHDVTNADLVFCQNNGVYAVVPTPHGRLASLIKKTVAGDDRVWVFKKPSIYHDEVTGDELVDHHARGLTVGTPVDLAMFSAMCERVGVRVASGGLFVPLSNGQQDNGAFDSDRHGCALKRGESRYFSDYRTDEMARCRWDLPTEVELMVLVAPPASAEDHCEGDEG